MGNRNANRGNLHHLIPGIINRGNCQIVFRSMDKIGDDT